VRVDAVTPGESFTFPTHSVSISWQTGTAAVGNGEESAGGAQSLLQSGVLAIGVGREVEELPATIVRQRVGGAQVSAQPGPAALVVGASAKVLARPGIDTLQEEISTVLAQPGSEEFVLLPAQGAGLRLLRLPGEQPQFLAELYGSDAEQPLSRATITGSEPMTLPTADDELQLTIAPITSLVVEVRQTPGRWLIIPGLLLAIAGLVSMRRGPEFLLAQIAPWPLQSPEPLDPADAQAVVILQSSSAVALASAASAFNTATANTSGATSPELSTLPSA